jgi:hypothetical protein
MIERIKSGTKPTEILEEIKARNPEYRNHDLATAFVQMIGVSSLDITQAIWYWKRYRPTGGFDDEQLDAVIIAVLKSLGLI